MVSASTIPTPAQRNQEWCSRLVATGHAKDTSHAECMIDRCILHCVSSACSFCALYKSTPMQPCEPALSFRWDTGMGSMSGAPFAITTNEHCLQFRARCVAKQVWACEGAEHGEVALRDDQVYGRLPAQFDLAQFQTPVVTGSTVDFGASFMVKCEKRETSDGLPTLFIDVKWKMAPAFNANVFHPC